MRNHNKNKCFINGLLTGLLSCLLWTSAQAAGPLWTMVPAAGSNPSQTVPENSTATVQYVVQNQSGKPKRLVIQPLPGISQATPCQLAPRGQAGSSCILNLTVSGSALPAGGIHGGPSLCQANPDSSPNPNQCYQPAAVHVLNLSKTEVPPDMATISISPTVVNVEAGAISDVVTIKNESGTVTANTLSFTSDIQLVNNQCNAPLPPQGSCSFQVQSAVTGQHTVSAQGSNTNAVSLTVNVSAVPLVEISIVGPDQQERIVEVNSVDALSLTIQNNDPVNPANNIHVISNHDDCQNLMVTPTGCDSVAAGDTCTLELSSATPYEPCEITVSGDNVANDLTTFIAFRTGGGLVFSREEDTPGPGDTTIKVVTGPLDDPDELTIPWSAQENDVSTSTDENSGPDNTDNIIAQGFPACDNADTCAAYRCRNLGAEWYLPARDELQSVAQVLCPGGASCNFGGFSSALYWSSSQNTIIGAQGIDFPLGGILSDNKIFGQFVRCVRAFNP